MDHALKSLRITRHAFAWIVLATIVVAVSSVLGVRNQRYFPQPLEGICTFEANSSSLKIPCAWIDHTSDAPEKMIQLKAIELDGVVKPEPSGEPGFYIWYLAKPHPSSGSWIFQRLGLNKEFFIRLQHKGENATIQLSLREPSGDPYFFTFDFRDGEWIAKTYLDQKAKPVRDSKGAATLLEWYFKFASDDRLEPIAFTSCYGFLRPGEDTPYQGGCDTDMEKKDFFVKIIFNLSLTPKRREILDAVELATESFLAAGFTPNAVSIVPK